MLNGIEMLCGMLCLYLLGLGSWYLLVLKALQVSTTLMHDLWCREQLVLEGGVVPVYVYIFRTSFTYAFQVCNYGSFTCLYAYAFAVFILDM